MFIHPDAPAITHPESNQPSQATHFAHQAKHLFSDPALKSQGLAFLNERTKARAGSTQTWDFPDGSAVHLQARGQLVVVRGESSGIFRWLRSARAFLFSAPVAQ